MTLFVKILDSISQIRIKSVTDSLFKYGFLALAILVAGSALKIHNWVLVLIAIISGLFVIVGLVFYIYFAKKRPDFLRSEDYQLRSKSLDLIGDKDNIKNTKINSIASIASPYGQSKNREIEIK